MSDDDILISVIIPAYNAEENLRVCLDSVLAQNYPHFEVLLINDGSKDQTASICDAYALSDPRFRVFHKANGGVSSARNYGIERSAGDYICFIDADDWVEPSYLKELIANADRPDTLVVLNHCIHQGGHVKKKWPHTSVRYEAREFSALFSHLDLLRNGFPFSKLFSSSIIRANHIRFDEEIHYAEDCFFLLEYLQYIQQMRYIDSAPYHYIDQPGNSLSSRYNAFASEYKGFLAGVRLTKGLIQQYGLNKGAQENIHLWLGKFFLRPLQSFYRGARPVVRTERLALLQKSHRPENVGYLRGLGPLRLPATIRISVELYRRRMFGLYDQYMSVLFKYHRFKLAKR